MLLALPVAAPAQEIVVEIELPRLNVVEYHEPYVAVWLAAADASVAANLAVWYMQEEAPEGEGSTWLKDLRQWWRRAGRTAELPIDGVTSATRAPGMHELTFSADSMQIKDLDDGSYTLMVEAVREVGGRELLSVPFDWPPVKGTAMAVSGAMELGKVSLTISP